jgi:hypothetical protein
MRTAGDHDLFSKTRSALTDSNAAKTGEDTQHSHSSDAIRVNRGARRRRSRTCESAHRFHVDQVSMSTD